MFESWKMALVHRRIAAVHAWKMVLEINHLLLLELMNAVKINAGTNNSGTQYVLYINFSNPHSTTV